jgi:protein-disulfide isomerase/uncharacterized membrane protein
MLVKNSGEIKPFPIYVYFSVILILTLCGIVVSGYLSVSHYRVYTDIDYSSFCAISKSINCDTVSQSPYSIFWGIPVPIWGVIGYIFLLATLLLSFNTKSGKIIIFHTLFLIGILFSIISIFLGILSAVKIHSYCLMCIVTYGINFMLLYMIWLMKQRFEKKNWKTAISENIVFWKSSKTKVFKFYSPLIVLTIAIMIFIPNYWSISSTDIGKRIIDTGFTEDGSPWIGAQNPELTITEYADYMCFQCKKMHFFLRDLISQHPEKIRLVHKQFPMDKKFNPLIKENFHSGAGILSLIAIYAIKENKFWELNDFLYHYNMNKGAIYLRQIALETGLELDALKTGIHDPEIKQQLKNDILSGLRNNISGTPSYVINNKVYTGQIPSDILNSIRK